MPPTFEQNVRDSFLAAKVGDRVNDVADVDVHFVLPTGVFGRYQDIIAEATDGNFNVAGGYNLVLLYTDPSDAQRWGTAPFGHDPDGLARAWSSVLEDIGADPDKASRLRKFQGAHSYFRSALWTQPNEADPCASQGLLPRRTVEPKTSFLKRLLN